MKIIVLSSFPLLDRHAYKKAFLPLLAAKPYANEICLLYHKVGLSGTGREILRLGLGEAFSKWKRMLAAPQTKNGDSSSVEPGTLSDIARRLNIPIKRFSRLSNSDCQDFLKSFSPDVMLNLSGQYIPPSVLSLPKIGVIGAHYGLLPRFRGTDTPRWNIFLDEPLTVCHMHLVEKMDRGDILLKQRVSVEKGDTYSDIYKKCQQLGAEGYLKILDQLAAGTLQRQPQSRADGNLFYRMGDGLRQKVDTMLADKAYTHYV